MLPKIFSLSLPAIVGTHDRCRHAAKAGPTWTKLSGQSWIPLKILLAHGMATTPRRNSSGRSSTTIPITAWTYVYAALRQKLVSTLSLNQGILCQRFRRSFGFEMILGKWIQLFLFLIFMKLCITFSTIINIIRNITRRYNNTTGVTGVNWDKKRKSGVQKYNLMDLFISRTTLI